MLEVHKAFQIFGSNRNGITLLFFLLFQKFKDALSSGRHGLEHIGNLRQLA